MTYPLANRPELAAASSIVSMLDCLDTVQLVSLKANYDRTRWELSIAGKQLGAVEKVPSWLFDETFEGNPTHVYDCHPYGQCTTQAEAIGRLFVGWLVEQKIAEPEVWTMEPRGLGFDYI
ncbi:hypothetical protein [Chamaesiphon polymorphus]|uniref:Uncharacterized protein n=1 Tax=Chamaesiphon polymorphus CCALA 037 TaxID=2107692 RepID=A0A2T1F972_9CYAN|nr:hypothetical protein [Chamaesiphon polymorphus]PSB41468.1 hypothetical protein C7B77_27380 [Chamaesiphon polymorphus CCALA 037]